MLRLLAAGLANAHVLERLSVERECAGRAGHRSLPLAGNKLASMWLQLVKTGRPNLLVENQIFTVLKHLSGVGTQMVFHRGKLCLANGWRRRLGLGDERLTFVDPGNKDLLLQLVNHVDLQLVHFPSVTSSGP